MKQFPPAGPVFDVGGGNGFVAKGMQDAGFEVVLLEPGGTGARNAQRRGIQNVVCAGLEDVGFRQASLAAAGLFDVVEHIEHDRKFLELLKGYLHPGGRIYLTVPAYEALWSYEDVGAGHFRRYSRQALFDLLRDSRFTVEFLTGFFQFLLPAIFLVRALPHQLGFGNTGSHDIRGTMRAQHEVRGVLVSKSLAWLQQRELNQIRKQKETTFGASWLLVAKKI